MSYGSAGNINWAFGDGGDEDNLSEVAGQYGYIQHEYQYWWNPDDDTNGDTIKTDQEMWQYVWDRRESEAEDSAMDGWSLNSD